jgi:hypothetical protein
MSVRIALRFDAILQVVEQLLSIKFADRTAI